MLQIVVILKAIIEVALFAFLGQGILYVLSGSKRNQNIVYSILQTVTSPVTKIARFISPRIVLDQHIWLVAIFLLIAGWIALTLAKVSLVLVPA